MVAITVIVATVAGVVVLGFVSDVQEPAPNVADTTGEFEVADGRAGSKQIVKITHIAGDDVPVKDIEIIVQATGPSLDTTAQLVDLPTEDTTVDAKNIEGNTGLIDKGDAVQTIQEDDSNIWSVGKVITFRVSTGEADFREGESPDADTLEVVVVHTPSNAIISENTFTP